MSELQSAKRVTGSNGHQAAQLSRYAVRCGTAAAAAAAAGAIRFQAAQGHTPH